MLRIFQLIGLIALLGLTACKGTKQAIALKEAATIKKRIASVKAANLDFEHALLTGKARIQLPGQSGKTSVGIRIQMQRGKEDWIVMRASKIIEAGRVKITSDSVIILDKLNQRVFRCGIELAKEYTGLDANVRDLQDLLLGNYNPMSNNVQLAGSLNGNPLVLKELAGLISFLYHIDTGLNKLVMMDVKTDSSQQHSVITYGEFEEQSNKKIPKEINVEVLAPQEISFELTYRKIDLKSQQRMQFSVPSHYEQAGCP